jgi:hypothetical protein
MHDQKRAKARVDEQTAPVHRLLESGKIVDPFYMLHWETIELAD